MIRFGEEMGEDLMNSVEDRVTNTVRNITMELLSKRIGVVSEMMNAKPKDLTYVFRVIEMVVMNIGIHSLAEGACAGAGRLRERPIVHYDLLGDKVVCEVGV